MRLKTKTPRTALASGRGKSEEILKANYKNDYTRRLDLELLKKIGRKEQNRLVAKLTRCVARSLERRANGGGNA